MEKLKLFYSDRSPYVRKVMVTLHEVNLFENVEIVGVRTNPLGVVEDLVDVSPLGKIPTLVLPDGTTIFDSRVICSYLNSIGKSDLYLAKENLKWSIKTAEANFDGILDAALLMVYEHRYRQDINQNAEWLENLWKKIERTLDFYNNSSSKILSGSLNMGQISLGCALGYLDYRHNNRNWRAKNQYLRDWFAEFSERLSMRNTIPRSE